MFAINIFLLIAGFFLPPVAVILMAAPILLPIVISAGFDPYWFAVILTINMEIGLITPPVGLNLYVINGIAPEISLRTILVGSLPFVACMVIAIIVVVPDAQSGNLVTGLHHGTSRMSRISYFQDLLSSLFERRASGAASPDARDILDLCNALLADTGEVTGLQTGSALLGKYAQADQRRKLAFFQSLASDFDIDTEALAQRTSDYANERSANNLTSLLEVAEPRRQELLRRLNGVPGGTEKLVRMREDLLEILNEDASLSRVDVDFEHLFSSWFNRGFLVLRPIDWTTPAHILEKIIKYEAVHAIHSWDDLRRRLQPADRRCFAYFHPAMPNEPLIFVEVALAAAIAGSIQAVLAENRDPVLPEDAAAAIFYSISNCQKGLRGVSFGNFLIKQVATDLSSSLPNIKTFITLSPIPGLHGMAQGPGGRRPQGRRSRVLHDCR